MPHCSSYACSNSTVKDSISKLSFWYHLNRSTRTETVVQWIDWDSHRHSVDARRLGWIDLTMKRPPPAAKRLTYLTYIQIYYIIKYNHLISLTKKNHKTNKHISKATSSAALWYLKIVYKLALHKMLLDGTFVHANIYKLYLLHSHARNSLITYK